MDIALFIAHDDPSAADRWMAAVEARVGRVAEFPFSGRKVPEWNRDDVRELILGNYPIMYRVRAEDVQVLRVVEGHRHLSDDAPTEE